MKYYIPDNGETSGDAQSLPGQDHPTSKTFCFQRAAVVAADWCHARRNGWEWDWPKKIVIIDEGGEEYPFEVRRDMVPEFVARELKTF